MKPLSFPWKLPDEALALLTKLPADDALVFVRTINAALEEACKETTNARIAAAIRALKGSA